MAQAARLEVEWWRVHRDVQRRAIGDEEALADALAALYAHVYAVPAGRRAPGGRSSARWRCATPIAGCRRAATSRARSCAEEREALVRSYAALLAAVHRS